MISLRTSILSVGLGIAAFASAANAKDTKLKLDALPKPVQTAIQSQAQGGKIEHIEQVSDDARLFEVEIAPKDGKKFELFITNLGEVVGKQTK